MALTVEDGTGVAGAESYISVAAASTYLADRGYEAWGDTSDPSRERALRLATDYMAQAYRGRWRGQRVASDQPLDWPRRQIVADGYYVEPNSIPQDIQRACALLALRSLDGDLTPDLARKTLRESVGSIEVEYDGDERTNPYRAVERLLSPYLMGLPNQVALVR
ncbi:MAG: DnaT-like ssDNA-binding protein [Pseudomonadota bacterium]